MRCRKLQITNDFCSSMRELWHVQPAPIAPVNEFYNRAKGVACQGRSISRTLQLDTRGGTCPLGHTYGLAAIKSCNGENVYCSHKQNVPFHAASCTLYYLPSSNLNRTLPGPARAAVSSYAEQ